MTGVIVIVKSFARPGAKKFDLARSVGQSLEQ